MPSADDDVDSKADRAIAIIDVAVVARPHPLDVPRTVEAPIIVTESQKARLKEELRAMAGDVISRLIDKIVDERVAAGLDVLKTHATSVTAAIEAERTVRLLSPKEAARELGVSLSTLKRMTLDGRIPAPIRISARRVGHRLSDLHAAMSAGHNPSRPR